MIIPLPTHSYQEYEHIETERTDEWVRWYITCPPWVCTTCGATMFGRMTYCVCCKLRKGIDTARPDWYVENVYEGDTK